MSARDLLRYALRALRSHRLRSGLSLLGVAIGVAAVVTLTALGEGARRYVTQQFTAIGSNILIVFPGRNETTGAMPGMGGVPNDLTLDDAVALRRSIPEVLRSAPVAMGTETASFGDRRRQVNLTGTTHELFEVLGVRMARGRALPPGKTGGSEAVAVLGKKVADELFPGKDAVGQVIRVGDWRLRVIGVTGPRGVLLGLDHDDVVWMPVGTAMRLLNRSSLFEIVLQVRTPAETLSARRKAVKLLSERHGEEDITCIRQDAVMGSFDAILNALTLALAAIAAISLAVAGIGIMNVMLVSVSERTREVGLLKALGAERRQIVGIFLAEAAALSTAGGLLGLLGGHAALGILLGFYPDLQAEAPGWAVAAALTVSTGVGVVFGVAPARRASRLDPVAALARR